MNENETLAQWLFDGPPEKDQDNGLLWRFHGRRIFDTPEFRISNQWAGALLEKLKEYAVIIEYLPDCGWCCHVLFVKDDNDMQRFHAADWRSAVVNAALEIARRAVNGSGDA